MPDRLPRPPKAPPKSPFIKGPDQYIRVPPDFFPPKPPATPEIDLPPDRSRRPTITPPPPDIETPA